MRTLIEHYVKMLDLYKRAEDLRLRLEPYDPEFAARDSWLTDAAAGARLDKSKAKDTHWLETISRIGQFVLGA